MLALAARESDGIASDMARVPKQRAAIVGVAEHSSSAVLVTVALGGEFLDRRRIDLIDRGLPAYPHHHEGSWAVGRYLKTPGARAPSLADAVALVERVRASAVRGARESLEALTRYAHEQGLVSRKLTMEDLFPPSVIEVSRI